MAAAFPAVQTEFSGARLAPNCSRVGPQRMELKSSPLRKDVTAPTRRNTGLESGRLFSSALKFEWERQGSRQLRILRLEVAYLGDRGNAAR